MTDRMLKPLVTVFLSALLLLQGAVCLAGTVKVGIRDARKTLEFSSLQGEATGALVDLWRLWGQENGYNLQFVVIPGEETMAWLRNGQIDVVANALPGDELVYSAPYFTQDFYLFTFKKHYLDSLTSFPARVGVLAIDEPFLPVDLLEHIQLRRYQNHQEMLEGMHSGVVNFMVANDISLNHAGIEYDLLLLNYPETPVYSHPIRAGTLAENRSLIEAFDSGFKKIRVEDIAAIKGRWMPSTIGFRLPWSFLGLALVVLLSSVLIVVVWVMNRKLEQKVAGQTRELEGQKRELEQDIERRKVLEGELQQAKTQADAATEAKSNFLANMTHELRTPLIGVLGMNELLLNTALNERQRALAVTVERSGETLLSLVSDILDFSKIESGHLSLNLTTVNFADIIEETTLLLAQKAAEKGLVLVCEVAPEACWQVLADPLRLRQILLNLISNAVKFTPQGEVSVRLGMSPVGADKGCFTLEVEDTGVGIKPEDQATIFAPFVQIDSTSTRAFGGTGLGLTIVSQLVKAMGGELGVESLHGQGSRFHVTTTLPLLAYCKPESFFIRHGRVLLQDYHTRRREALERKLTFLGFEVATAASVEQALQNLLNDHAKGDFFDLVLIPTAARVSTGEPLYEKIRQEKVLQSLPLIGLCSCLSMLNEDYPDDLALLEEPVTWGNLLAALKGCAGEPKQIPAATTGGVAMKFRKADSREVCEDTVLPGSRILVADDYAVTRDLVRHFLAADGLVIDEATSGKEVLALTANTQYDLILMDCNMPEMSGMEATRILRKQGHLAPIVALTAHVDRRIYEECRAAGMNDYLPKPFRGNELRAKVERWLVADQVDLSAGST